MDKWDIMVMVEREAYRRLPPKRPKPNKTTHDQWVDCDGTEFWVHRWNEGCRDGCAIHAPSKHHMSSWPQRMNASTLVERVCEHGFEHPDPDSFRYFQDRGHEWIGVHNCDNCCVGSYHGNGI